MVLGIKEQIRLPEGQAYRLLRWTDNLREVDVVLSNNRSVRLHGEGDHWHYHRAMELTLFTQGQGTRFVGDRIAPFQAGEVVLLGENLPHHWRTRGSSSGLSVQWDFPPGHPFWSFPETQEMSAFFRSAARGILFSGETARVLTAQLHRMTGSTPLFRFGLLLQVLATAEAAPARDVSYISAKPFALSTDARHQSAMRDAVQFLLAHFRDEVRIEQLLRLTHMSKATFCRHFRKNSGKTVSEFLQQVRLYAACQELEETDHSIVDVAFASGFSQISFFNRVFRRTFKCNPTAYRNRFRKPHPETADRN